MLYLIRFDSYQVTYQAIIAGENIKDARAKLKTLYPAAMKMKTEKFSVAHRDRLASSYHSDKWSKYHSGLNMTRIESGDIAPILPFEFTWS